jgi:adenylylsulfate kinase
VPERDAEGVLITGVYGSGKSAVAAEITYLLEQRDQRYALLDLDYLGWVGDHATGYRMMLRNLAAIAPHYRDAGIDVFVVAFFIRDIDALRNVQHALGVPLRVVRLSVPWPAIQQRLSGDVTSGRGDDLSDAAASIAINEGVGLEDIMVDNDRPVGTVAREVMTWLGWL